MMILILHNGIAFAADAVLSWDPNTETDLAGYKVYYGTASGVYTSSISVGFTSTPTAPQYLVGNLNGGTTYYFSITSFDSSANESGFSSEVSKTFPAEATGSMDITDFTAIPGEGQITLSWNDPSDSNYKGVVIRVRTDGTYPTDPDNDGDLVGNFPGQPLESKVFVHASLNDGLTYYYSAFSYDANGNFTHTVHASAAPTASPSTPQATQNLSSQNMSGGCGMIRDIGNGKPPAPGQAADMVALPIMILIALMRKRARWVGKTAYAIFTLLLAFGLSLSDPDKTASAASPPPLYDVMVVLGNGGLTTDITNYRPTDEMRRRTKWAGYLFLRNNIASHIIVSGAGQWDSVTSTFLTSEAASMKMMLADMGVDPSKIILEQKSSTTAENASFSSAIIIANGWKTVALVSNNNTCWGNDGQAVWAAPLFDPSLQVFPNPYRLNPVADAGASKTVSVNTAVSLQGSAYDLTSCALVSLSSATFHWEQVGGPSITLASPNTATSSFTPTQLGDYRFRLVVNTSAEGGGLYQYLQDEVTVHVTQNGFPGTNASMPKGINGAIFGGAPAGPGDPGPNLLALADMGADLYREGYLVNLLIAGGEKDGAAGTRSRDNSSAGMIATNLFFRSNISLSKITRNDSVTDLAGKISWAKTTAQSKGWTSLALIATASDMPTVLNGFAGSGITVYPVVASPLSSVPIPSDTTPPAAPVHLVVQ